MTSSRYARAASETPISRMMRAVHTEGYWIEDHLYFFTKERWDPNFNRFVSTPWLVDMASQEKRQVLQPEEIYELIGSSRDVPFGELELNSTQYDMPERDRLAIRIGHHGWYIDTATQTVLAVERFPDSLELYAPDGRSACFVDGHNLSLRDRRSGQIRAITRSGAQYHAIGQAPETSLCAIDYRRRPWPLGIWSPNSEWLLTHQIDERGLQELSIVETGSGAELPRLHRFKHSAAGDELGKAVYKIIHVESGRVISLDAFHEDVRAFSPLACGKAWFSPDSLNAYFIRTDRARTRTELIGVELASGNAKVIISEDSDSGYIDLHPAAGAPPNIRVLNADNEIIWYSERSGWGHLYLYDLATGSVKGAITAGEWQVRDVVHVDCERRRIFFTAGGQDPDQHPSSRRLCCVGFDGGEVQTLLACEGDVAVRPLHPALHWQDRPFRPAFAPAGFSPSGRFASVRQSSAFEGSREMIVDLQTGKEFAVDQLVPAAVRRMHGPSQFKAKAADGRTELHGALFFPADFDEAADYGLVVYVYPGPQSTTLPQSFQFPNAGHAQAIAELGFVTLMLDTRGLPFRSRALHQAGYGDLAEPQLADHVAVVSELCRRHSFLDSTRIGIVGQSAGGYAAARALFDYPAVFKVAVSVCGNHEPRLYSGTWIETYCGARDEIRWAQQSNVAKAPNAHGHIMLVHGEMDQNVHVSHTLALAQALIRSNKDFELLIVPGEGHAVMQTSAYAQRRIWDFLVRNLPGQAPSETFRLEHPPGVVAKWLSRSSQDPYCDGLCP